MVIKRTALLIVTKPTTPIRKLPLRRDTSFSWWRERLETVSKRASDPALHSYRTSVPPRGHMTVT